jgi:aminomuconate-semialdehyde/2-hydroxymuconate-6-semialdehyde dehydrogenase
MNKVGVPKGVYNVVHGLGPDSAGECLTQHPLVNAITFTGETRTGEAIMRQAALGIRQVSFELGGKNPALVFADCDIDKAIEGTMRSVFANCGQVCLGTERVYVERPIFEEFVRRLKAGAEALKLGRPDDQSVNLGPLISQEHRDKVLSYYRKAVDEGATVVTGGGVPSMPGDLANGAWVQPTIWTGLADDALLHPRGNLRPLLPYPPLRHGGGGHPPGQRHDLWPCRRGLDGKPVARPSRRRADGCRHLLGQFVVPARPAHRPSAAPSNRASAAKAALHSLEFYTELSNVCIKL